MYLPAIVVKIFPILQKPQGINWRQKLQTPEVLVSIVSIVRLKKRSEMFLRGKEFKNWKDFLKDLLNKPPLFLQTHNS